MGLRRQAREVALQALFVCDFTGKWAMSSVQLTFDHFGVPAGVKPFAERLCQGVIDNITTIDSELTKASQNWSITRMARVDRSILRVACYEILYLPDVPNRVAINEAIEISKRYSADDSPSFINGVLDRLASTSSLSSKITAAPIPGAEDEATPESREQQLERILLG
jgi:N utilization substance protein B